MVFAGPSPESIESFGLKHTARELATKAGVPVVPGTKSLVESEDEAIKESNRLGFPVYQLRKATPIQKLTHVAGNAQGNRWRRWYGISNLSVCRRSEGIFCDREVAWGEFVQKCGYLH